MMKMNKKGMTATEAILIVFIFICFAGAAWYGMSKKTESNKFADQSKQIVVYHVYVTKKYALLDFKFSPFEKLFNWGDPNPKQTEAETETTTVVNDTKEANADLNSVIANVTK